MKITLKEFQLIKSGFSNERLKQKNKADKLRNLANKYEQDNEHSKARIIRKQLLSALYKSGLKKSEAEEQLKETKIPNNFDLEGFLNNLAKDLGVAIGPTEQTTAESAKDLSQDEEYLPHAWRQNIRIWFPDFST